MHNKRLYNNDMNCRGSGRRGRGRRMGRRGFGAPMQQEGGMVTGRGGRRGPQAMAIDDVGDFGPPPWSPRWGWMEENPAVEGAEATFGPPPWGRGRRMWMDTEAAPDERRAWLEARRARLQAWQQHLEARLAETEAELAGLDATDSSEPAD